MIRLAALSCLAVLPALAQTPPPQTAPPLRPGAGITREQFIQRAADAAGRRFDTIDTAHAGVITRDQLRAFREARAAGAAPPR